MSIGKKTIKDYGPQQKKDKSRILGQLKNYLADVDQTIDQGKEIGPTEEGPGGISSWFYNGAEGGTRTRTGLHPLSPEPSASTNSATSAIEALALGQMWM